MARVTGGAGDFIFPRPPRSTGRPLPSRRDPGPQRGGPTPEGYRCSVRATRPGAASASSARPGPAPTGRPRRLRARSTTRRGVLFSSSFEFPGRYTRWDMGFVDPPLVLTARGRALHGRGAQRARPGAAPGRSPRSIGGARRGSASAHTGADRIDGRDRARAASAFPGGAAQPAAVGLLGIARARRTVRQPEDEHLGLLRRVRLRPRLPVRADARCRLPRARRPARPRALSARRDPDRRSHAAAVGDPSLRIRGRRPLDRRAAARDPAGALSSPTPARRCRRKATTARANTPRWCGGRRRPSSAAICSRSSAASCSRRAAPTRRASSSSRLRRANPAPYGALINLGEGEFLVSASPEMYVRVEGRRIETCPICGTIARGRDALEDAERIRELLNSTKDESELTMCTDVDRNDKSRVCVPGSVKVIGRRQIEMYSRLIHTVDHVEGELRARIRRARRVSQPRLGGDRDRRAETVGDPLYRSRRSARRGAGTAARSAALTFDGNMNTGLTLRTMRMKDGRRRDPRRRDPALRQRPRGRGGRDAGSRRRRCSRRSAATRAAAAGRPRRVRRRRGGRKVLLIDHEDSFVHTLAGYIRTTGAEVATLRHDFARARIARRAAARSGRAVAGAGPARRFRDAPRRSTCCSKRNIPVFGVCLGLQGIVEYFGGALGVLDVPMHGKPSPVRRLGEPAARRPAGAVHGRALPLAVRERGDPAGGAVGRPRRPRTASSWRSSTRACRSRRCSSIPNW